MRYRTLGRSGLRVSELCLGTMTFGEDWGWGASKSVSREIFDAFVEAGGNFIDTANSYTGGTSERFVGEFIASDRDRFVVGTKYTQAEAWEDPNGSGNHRKNLVRSLEASLRRLDTEYVDVLWLHAWDFLTPIDEVLRALDDLVSAGKVLYLGISDTPAWIVARSNTLAELRGWTSFVGLQVEYSLAERTVERELLPMADELGLGVTAWAPLAAGLLTGKYSRGSVEETDADSAQARGRLDEADLYAGSLTERNLRIARTVDEIADELGTPSATVALAWLLRRDEPRIPIVGARRPDQLGESLGAPAVALTEEQLGTLDDVSRPDLGFPHDFLRSDPVRHMVYGGTYESIET